MCDFIDQLALCEQFEEGHKGAKEAVGFLVSLSTSYTGKDVKCVERFEQLLQKHSRLPLRVINDLVANLNMRVAFGTIAKTYSDFVGLYAENRELSCSLDGRITESGEHKSGQRLFSEMRLFTVELKKFTNENDLKKAWEMWLEDQRLIAISELSELIRFHKTDEELWEQVISGLVDENRAGEWGLSRDEYLLCAKKVMQGFMWRVKNKILGRYTTQHIMPYLRGVQGSGKTTFLRLLLDPVEDATTSTNFSMFNHDERMQALANSYVLLFDEMARLDRTDADTLKNMMTSDFFDSRKLYQGTEKKRVVASFIGAGNGYLSEILNDPTGSRRFMQIETKKNLDPLNEKLKQDTDALHLWWSVDENAADPLSDRNIINLLMRLQLHSRNTGIVDQYVQHIIDKQGFSAWIDVEDIWMDYLTWRDTHAQRDTTTPHGFKTKFARIVGDMNNSVVSVASRKNPSSLSRRKQYIFNYDHPLPPTTLTDTMSTDTISGDAIDQDTNAALQQVLDEVMPNRPLH